MTTAGDLKYSITDYVDMEATAAGGKYGVTRTNDWTAGTGEEIVADATTGIAFYFPKEPTTAVTGQTDAGGDRWNTEGTADKITGFAGTGAGATAATPATSCFADKSITLGAVHLAAAGAGILAAALAF